MTLPRLLAMAPREPATEIHDSPCERCPSERDRRNGITDWESDEIKAGPRSYQLDSVFRCAWRTEKLCKGYCDFLGVTEADVKAHLVAGSTTASGEASR